MDDLTVLVFPGLDGSDTLLREFVAAAPAKFNVRTITLPDATSYWELAEKLDSAVLQAGPCVLIGESFSGPLAILLAQHHPSLVKHLVLTATFATPPIPSITKYLPWSLLFRMPLPRFAARLLIGDHDHLLLPLREAVKMQSARIKAKRISMVATTNVVVPLLKVKCPITYLAPTRDRLVHQRHGLAISKTNQSSQIRHIDGPHLILQACPEACWAEIKAAIEMDKPQQ